MLIESEAGLREQVGRVVTLHGTVANSKIATLLGVEVASEAPDLRGREAFASGRLETYQSPDPMRGGVIRAGRAPGVYLRLVDPSSGQLAPVRAKP